MIKKIILFIVIFILLMPSFYFYSREFSKAWSSFRVEKKIAIPEKESDIDPIRQEIIDFILENILTLFPSGLRPSEIPLVDRFWFVKDSYKEVYVEYSYQEIKGKILVHVIGYDREERGEGKTEDLAKYLIFNYYEFEKGMGWKLKKDIGEDPMLDFKAWGLYGKGALKISTHIREHKEDKLDLILYLTAAYFEPSKDGWKLKTGKDISIDTSLDLYEYGCDENDVFNLKYMERDSKGR